MVLRRVVLLTLMLLTLAGCYKQADEGFEPVTIPGDQTTVPVVTTIATQTSEPVTDATATDSSISVDEPTNTPEEEQEPTNTVEEPTTDVQAGPTNTQPLIITIEPTNTATVESGNIDNPTDTVDETPGATVFITPGQPDLPVTMETNTPEPGQETTTPIITPTDFFNPNSGDTCEYVVQRGDTLYIIATDNNITVAELRAANPDIQGDLIVIGDTLQIPGCGGGTDGEEPEPTETEPAPVEGGVIHVVKSGESLYTIAQQYGVTVQDIIDANELTNPDRISIGQELIIPTEDE